MIADCASAAEVAAFGGAIIFAVFYWGAWLSWDHEKSEKKK